MKRNDGYTLIELVLVLFLLVLVAVSVFTLAVAGSRSYLRLESSQRQAADMRIGLSYLDVKLRQNDRRDAIELAEVPGDDQTALRISRIIGEETYYTWIYLHEGYLCEMFLPADREFAPELGSRIVPVSAIAFSRPADDVLRVVLTGGTGDGTAREMTRVFYLRAGGEAE